MKVTTRPVFYNCIVCNNIIFICICKMNKTAYIYTLLLSIFVMFSSTAYSKFTILNDEQGLSNNLVTAISKDNTGNLWVGTRKGLNQYDGYSFFAISIFNKSIINCLQYDKYRDLLWIGTDKGLFYLNCSTKQVVNCLPPNKIAEVTNILMNGKELIIGFRHKYILQIKENLSCEVVYCFSNRFLGKNKMTMDSKNTIHLLFSENGQVIKCSKFSKNADVIYINNPHLSSFTSHFDNQVFVCYIDKGIQQLHPELKMPSYVTELNKLRGDPEYVIQNKKMMYIVYRNPTNLYEINTENGLTNNLIDDKQGVLFNKLVFCLYLDNFNTLWIGTNKGLVKYTRDNPTPKFDKLLVNAPKPISTREITEDVNGDLYVATYAGFLKYDKKIDQWKNFNQIVFNGKLSFFYQRALLNVSSRYMYLGTDANYFVRYDKQKQTFESDFIRNSDNECWKIKSVLSMAMDCNGLVWLGTDKGLVSLDTVNNEVKCHNSDAYNIGLSYVRYIYMLPGKKQFWAGCEDGLFLVDVDKGVTLHLDENSTPALSENMINCISTDFLGNTWIATSQCGINVLSPDYRSIYTITRKDGLSSNEVYNFLWEDSNKVWISTYNGLNLYNTVSKSLYSYHANDGISDNEFNQNSALKGKDGKLYFGGINGITSFYPQNLETPQKSFNIFASRITKFDNSSERIIDLYPNIQNNAIVINPGDNLLSLSFAVNDYNNSEVNTYSYKIQGLHSDWISLGEQNTLRLESLKPGEYDLYVRALKGSRGLLSVNTLIYHLSIKHVFYQTVWFYVFISALLAFIIYFYFYLRLKSMMQLERLRVKIASNLHDDVGSLLTRITMSTDNLANKLPSENENKEKLKNVSELSREANIAMSDVLWAIDARNDLTSSMTDRMREHAEDMLMPKGIEVDIDFSKVDQQQKLSPEFRQHLFLLYKEAINNIIKHSQASNVYIQYEQDKDHCQLLIRNNGARDNNDQVVTGQGLKNIKMRAEQIKGKASIVIGNKTFEVLVRI